MIRSETTRTKNDSEANTMEAYFAKFKSALDEKSFLKSPISKYLQISFSNPESAPIAYMGDENKYKWSDGF